MLMWSFSTHEYINHPKNNCSIVCARRSVGVLSMVLCPPFTITEFKSKLMYLCRSTLKVINQIICDQPKFECQKFGISDKLTQINLTRGRDENLQRQRPFSNAALQPPFLKDNCKVVISELKVKQLRNGLRQVCKTGVEQFCLLLFHFLVVSSNSRRSSLTPPQWVNDDRRRGQLSCHSCHNREPRTKKQHTEKVFAVETKKIWRFLAPNTLKCKTGNMFIYALELWLHSGVL